MTREIALSLAADLALRKRIPIAFFSLDRPAKDVISDLLSVESKIDSYRLANGALGAEDFSRITETAGRLFEAPFYIIDTFGDIAIQVQKLRSVHGVEVVFAASDWISELEGFLRDYHLSWIWFQKGK